MTSTVAPEARRPLRCRTCQAVLPPKSTPAASSWVTVSGTWATRSARTAMKFGVRAEVSTRHTRDAIAERNPLGSRADSFDDAGEGRAEHRATGGADAEAESCEHGEPTGKASSP